MIQRRRFKTALITGIAGSGGSYLADHITQYHPEVVIHGIARWHSAKRATNSHPNQSIQLHECDLNDLSSTIRAVKSAQPDVIFNLAAHANVRACFDTPISVMQNNIMSTHNLFEAVRLCDIDPIIIHCSTSEVYGQVDPDNVPINEQCPLNPVSPYAVSKTTQDLLSYSYQQSFGLNIIRTRMFSYLNPRRSDLFSTSFALQVAQIEAGLKSCLMHGNLESTRTLIDVRDAMASYWLTAELGEPGEVYNIGGTTILSVGEFLNILNSHAHCDIPSKVDPSLLRPADVTLQIPDTTKFKLATDWKERYSFEESIGFLLDECRQQIRSTRPNKECQSSKELV